MNKIERQYKNQVVKDKKNTSQIYQIKDIDRYLNLPLAQIAKKFGIANNTTAVTRELTKLFLKDSNFRSVRRNMRGAIQEAIPLDNINFETIIRENFEDSSLYHRFKQGFYFLVYDQETSNTKSLILKYAFLWKPNEMLIKNNVYPFWLEVKNITNKGVEIQRVKRGTKYINQNNLPKTKDNLILHVRPKAKSSADTTPLPHGGNITKQAYWINGSYIKTLINDLEQEILLENNIPDKDSNRLNTNQKKIIRKKIYNGKYSSEYYKGRLEDYPILKIIYTKNEYRKTKEDYKTNKILNNILNNDYEIRYGYYINKAFNSMTEAIEHDILNLEYLDINNYEYTTYNVFYSLLINLRKKLRIIEVGKDRFITERTLKKGGVGNKEITDFIEEVITFAEKQKKYFNIKFLQNNGIASEMFDLGFQDIFYEEILKNSGRFEYQTYKGNIMFTINKVESSVFSDLVMKHILASRELYRYEIGEMLENEFKIKNLSQTDILNFYDSKQGIHYCPHMDMFFETEDRYLDIILRRKTEWGY